MAKEIWNSNEPVIKHRPMAAAPAQGAPKRRDPWGDDRAPAASKWVVWGGIALVVILLFVFLLRPAWVGYQTYKAMEDSGVPGEYALKMDEYRTRAELAEAQAAQAVAAMQAAKAEETRAVQDRDAAKTQYDEYLASFQQDSQSKAAALDSCEEALNMQEPALADAARRICCVQRVDNPAINGYEIQDGRITCVTDGGDEIDC